MSNYAKLYWLTRLDYLQGFFITVSVIMGLFVIGYGVYFLVMYMEMDEPNIIKGWKRNLFITGLFLSIMISCLIPTRNEAILIMAGGKTMDYIESDTSLSKIPYQTTKIISEYLDKQLSEMKEKK